MIASHLCWALLLTAATLVLTDEERLYQDLRPCNIPCCSSYNNCNKTLPFIFCYCSDKNLRLRSDWIPASVSEITLIAKQVIISKNALVNYPSLQELHIKNLTRLYVPERGLALVNNSKFRLLSIEDVKKVTIKGSAFSGFWHQEAYIQMKAIQELSMSEEAFNYSTIGKGPELKLMYIETLNLASMSVMAPVKTLTMVHVNMPTCPCGNFNDHIRHLNLQNVVIQDVEEGCIKGHNGTSSLTIHSSRLQSISRLGIDQHFNTVRITNSVIENMQYRAIEISVAEIIVIDTRFQNLENDGLSAWVLEAIYFKNITVHMEQGLKKCSRDKMSSNIAINSTKSGLDFEKCSKRGDIGLHLQMRQLKKHSLVCSTDRSVWYMTCSNEDRYLYRAKIRNLDLRQQDSAHKFTKNHSGHGITNRTQTATDDTFKTPAIIDDRFAIATTTEDSLTIQTPTDDKLTIATTTEDRLNIQTTTDDKFTTITTTEDGLTTKITTNAKFTTLTATDDTSNTNITGDRKLKTEKQKPATVSAMVHDTPEIRDGDGETDHTTMFTLTASGAQNGPKDTSLAEEAKEVNIYNFHGAGGQHLVVLYCVLGVVLLLLVIIGITGLTLVKRRAIPALGPADVQLEARAAPSIRPPPPPDSPPDVIDLARRPRQMRYGTADDWREHLSRLPLNDQYSEYHHYEEIRPELERLPPSDEAYMVLLRNQRSSVRESNM